MIKRSERAQLFIDGFFLLLNSHDLKGLTANIAPDCEMHIPSSGFIDTGCEAIRAHLEDFIETFPTIWFRDFVTVADVETRRVAARLISR